MADDYWKKKNHENRMYWQEKTKSDKDYWKQKNHNARMDKQEKAAKDRREKKR